MGISARSAMKSSVVGGRHTPLQGAGFLRQSKQLAIQTVFLVRGIKEFIFFIKEFIFVCIWYSLQATYKFHPFH